MRLGTLVYALVFAAATLGSTVDAGVPTDQLRGATDRVLKVLQDAELKQPAKRDARRQQIRSIADEIFDWQETGKRALARHWQERSPSERQEFSTLFADRIERSYISKIEQYSGERVMYAGETFDQDAEAKAFVRSPATGGLDDARAAVEACPTAAIQLTIQGEGGAR